MLTFQSGRPFTVALLSEIDNAALVVDSRIGANDRPNLISNPELSSRSTTRGSIRRPFASQHRHLVMRERTILDGPGYQSVNASLIKTTQLTESVNLQFRVEASISSITQTTLADNFLGSPTFCQITSARDPRHLQFGLSFCSEPVLYSGKRLATVKVITAKAPRDAKFASRCQSVI